MEKNEKDYDFENRQVELPKMFLVADLTDKPIKTGFPWGKSGPKTKIIRPTDEPIWIVEKKLIKVFYRDYLEEKISSQCLTVHLQ
ncbi:MAG: hypothetical protein IPL23_23165 [Saprospiraceae bacterium]|nr:hypothetical protein [Saprospiraceae bacterium]